MHCKSVSYILRTTRLLQSLGVRIPSRSGLVLLHEIKPCTPASTAASIPIRFLSQSAEEKNTWSIKSDSSSSDEDHVHVLCDEYSQKTDKDQRLDREQTILQSTDPPKKLFGMELLDAFSSNSHSSHELYCTIMSLWKIVANKKLKSLDKKVMSEHPNFYNLCYEVMKSAPSMSNRFLVYSLNFFLYLQVNQSTRLLQTLLNVCQQRLSTLKMVEICMLARCMKMLESNKNVEILHSRFCLLIELKYEAIKDVATLQTLMRVAPAHLFQKLEAKALQMIDQFTVLQCHNMFSILDEMNLPSDTLLNSCSHIIINCIDEFSSKRIISLSRWCSKLMYVNEKLLSALCDNLMNNLYMLDCWEIAMFLQNIAFLRFRYVPLLDYFADKIMEESQLLSLNRLVTASKVFSLVNHLPEGKEDKLLETLDTALHLLKNSMKKIDVLKVLYNFCLLGLVTPSAINELLEDKSFISTLKPKEKSYLSHIERCLVLDQSSNPLLKQDLKMVEANYSHSVDMCHIFLKNYFKDPTLYQENMQVPNSYFMDFVLTLDREQSRLIPTGGIKNFEGSENLTRIAVLCCMETTFTLGSLHPIGKLALKLRNLKLLGFTVVVIPVNQFMMLTEAEKGMFLRKNIFKDISSSQTSTQANETD